jgi:hypothetical protein
MAVVSMCWVSSWSKHWLERLVSCVLPFQDPSLLVALVFCHVKGNFTDHLGCRGKRETWCGVVTIASMIWLEDVDV